MSIGPLRTFPLVVAAISGFVLSGAPVTGMAGVIEQSTTLERTQPIGEVTNVNTVGFVSPQDLFESAVIVTIAGKNAWFDFDISAAASRPIDSIEPLAVVDQQSGPRPSAPNYRTDVGARGVDPAQSVPTQSGDEVQRDAKHHAPPPISGGMAPGSYDQFQNHDVAPEFKAIYRIASANVDAVAPWTKPIYRTIDSAFQANMEAPPLSPGQVTIKSFDDDDWFVSRFIKFFLSTDSLPYLIVFFAICIMIAGLLRLLRITAPTR